MFCGLAIACNDPGRPADGRQIATSYEIGSVVVFECDRPGFVPQPASVVCVYDGVTSQWNDSSLKVCVGKCL